MHLTEIAPRRWVVREEKRGKILGIIEWHEYTSYTPEGMPFVTGHWMGRLPADSWKDSSWERGGWLKAETKDEAIAFLNGKKRKARARKEAER